MISAHAGHQFFLHVQQFVFLFLLFDFFFQFNFLSPPIHRLPLTLTFLCFNLTFVPRIPVESQGCYFYVLFRATKTRNTHLSHSVSITDTSSWQYSLLITESGIIGDNYVINRGITDRSDNIRKGGAIFI